MPRATGCTVAQVASALQVTKKDEHADAPSPESHAACWAGLWMHVMPVYAVEHVAGRAATEAYEFEIAQNG